MRHASLLARDLTLVLCCGALLACAVDDPDPTSSESTDSDQVLIVRENTSSSASEKGLAQSFIAQTASYRELVSYYPAEVAARIDPALLKADVIVGWYDKGHNYHKEHMKAAEFGDELINPAAFRGIGL